MPEIRALQFTPKMPLEVTPLINASYCGLNSLMMYVNLVRTALIVRTAFVRPVDRPAARLLVTGQGFAVDSRRTARALQAGLLAGDAFSNAVHNIAHNTHWNFPNNIM